MRLASFARVRLVRHALPISLLILRKKPTVLQSNHEKAFQSSLNRLKIGFVGLGQERILPRSRKSMFTNIKSVLRVYDLANSRFFLVETNSFHSRIRREWCIPVPAVNDVFFSATLLVWCSSSAISPPSTLFFLISFPSCNKLPFISLPPYTRAPPSPSPRLGPSTCKQKIHLILSPSGVVLL